MKPNWGVYSLRLEAVLGSRQAGGLRQQKCFEIEDQVEFSAPGMDQLTGIGHSGDWEHGEQLHRRAVGAVEDSKLNTSQRCTPAGDSSLLLGG